MARADKDKSSAQGTPLTLAAGAGHLEIVRLLIIASAQLEKVDSWQYTPLARALEGNHTEVVRLLSMAEAHPL